MYNINYYQNSIIDYSYYSQYRNNPRYNNYNNYSNYFVENTNYQTNANKYSSVIKLYPSNNNPYSNYPNYNYLTKTPIQTPLINNYQQINQIKYKSKSPEPYIRYYKNNVDNNENNYNHITNLNVNIKQNNYPLNIKINNIQKINRIIKISPYKMVNQRLYHAKTPEPNLRKRNKLKQRKNKANNFKTRTFIQLNTNNIQNINTHNANNENKTEYLLY